MGYIQFDNALRVGNKVIDNEHQLLIRYINELNEANQMDNPYETVKRVLSGLVEYTNTHFFLEEELMKAYSYPDYESHKRAHDAFKQRMTALNEEMQRGEMDLSNSMMGFLTGWLTDHILKVDRKLADYLKTQSW